MPSRSDLRKLARARLADAWALHAAGRFDGAVYMGGYVLEMALKARICQTLKWDNYPTPSGSFAEYEAFRTHKLDTLLHLSGVEGRIKSRLLVEWTTVREWNPMARYEPIGQITRDNATDMLAAVETILRAL